MGRYVVRCIALLTEMMNRWAACTGEERNLVLAPFIAWLDGFRREIGTRDVEPAAGWVVAPEAG